MHCGKQPDVQLCVQADAGTGSSHHLAALPARLNTALDLMVHLEEQLVEDEGRRQALEHPGAEWAELLHKEFEKESDRACVILAAALLEAALEELLRNFLVPNPSGTDSLIDGQHAPFGNYSSKIDACHRLGLISAQFSRDLHLIRRIRNEFAHNISGCTFESGSVKDRVRNLSKSHKLGSRLSHLREGRFPSGPRGDFQFAVAWMQWHVRGLVTQLSQLRPAELEWGYQDNEE